MLPFSFVCVFGMVWYGMRVFFFVAFIILSRLFFVHSSSSQSFIVASVILSSFFSFALALYFSLYDGDGCSYHSILFQNEQF